MCFAHSRPQSLFRSRLDFSAPPQPPRLCLRFPASSMSLATPALPQTMFYGEPDHNTYIIEVNGAGCAFFDYDNDGWMDIFILGGRTLEGIPPGASNRLYHNNRDGTFTDVTAKAGLD